MAFHRLCAVRVIAIRYLLYNEDDNCHSSIIMDISKTNFINLKIIDLSNFMINTVNNEIESIEQLQFMNMPLFEELYLGKISNNFRVEPHYKSKCLEQVCLELIKMP